MSGSTTVNFVEAYAQIYKESADRVASAIQALNGAAIKAAEEMLKLQKKHEIETERIEAWELEKGDIIVEFQTGKRPKLTEILELEHSSCASRGTHVNKNWCYDARALVWVRI